MNHTSVWYGVITPDGNPITEVRCMTDTMYTEDGEEVTEDEIMELVDGDTVIHTND